jgi:hypothetical protein
MKKFGERTAKRINILLPNARMNPWIDSWPAHIGINCISLADWLAFLTQIPRRILRNSRQMHHSGEAENLWPRGSKHGNGGNRCTPASERERDGSKVQKNEPTRFAENEEKYISESPPNRAITTASGRNRWETDHGRGHSSNSMLSIQNWLAAQSSFHQKEI